MTSLVAAPATLSLADFKQVIVLVDQLFESIIVIHGRLFVPFKFFKVSYGSLHISFAIGLNIPYLLFAQVVFRFHCILEVKDSCFHRRPPVTAGAERKWRKMPTAAATHTTHQGMKADAYTSTM